MEEMVTMPPVLVPTLVPQRVECRLVGEVAPCAFFGSDAFLSGVTCELRFFSSPVFVNSWLVWLKLLVLVWLKLLVLVWLKLLCV
jgi:hypothetical protein